MEHGATSRCRPGPALLRSLAVLAALVALPPAAEAGSATVKPHQLVPEVAANARTTLASVYTVDAAVRFRAPVRLPVGARITGLGHWYWRLGTCGSFDARLYRFRRDVGFELIAMVGATQVTQGIYSSGAAWEEATPVYPTRARVLRGYQYFVEVRVPPSAADTCQSGGARVLFRK